MVDLYSGPLEGLPHNHQTDANVQVALQSTVHSRETQTVGPKKEQQKSFADKGIQAVVTIDIGNAKAPSEDDMTSTSSTHDMDMSINQSIKVL